jgi:hypothetical protein
VEVEVKLVVEVEQVVCLQALLLIHHQEMFTLLQLVVVALVNHLVVLGFMELMGATHLYQEVDCLLLLLVVEVEVVIKELGLVLLEDLVEVEETLITLEDLEHLDKVILVVALLVVHGLVAEEVVLVLLVNLLPTIMLLEQVEMVEMDLNLQ